MAELAAGRIPAGLPAPHRPLLELARQVTIAAYATTDEQVQACRSAGWTDAQIAEAVYVTALFAFFNRVADAFGIRDQGYGGPRPDWDREA